MEEFKAKTSKVRHEIDQAEEREKAAIKKLAFANYEADEREKEADALKRRKRLLEEKLDSVEDRIFDKEKIYREELARKERDDRQRKILDEIEEEDERKMEKLEAAIRQYGKSADYSETKCAECWRRLQTVTWDTDRFKQRLKAASGKAESWMSRISSLVEIYGNWQFPKKSDAIARKRTRIKFASCGN
ncbi:hypothetical protein OS493_017879 [Desmophyllum pertusum]|uniref:Uncharacterized protein n=1 Tax=Desmophyllum pertusum TaxID=174260 RepID=A0A9W9Z2Q3_9CNID|nr:hypothetical protein OS493_017879 [Desmophyllum pertusum]